VNEVWVVAADALTAAGAGLAPTWEAVGRAESAIRPVTRFPTAKCTSRTAALIEDLHPAEGDSFFTALFDRVLDRAATMEIPVDALLYASSTKAAVDMLEKSVRGLPTRTEEALPAAVTARARARLGVSDLGTHVSAACASSTTALALAGAALASGRAEAAVIVAADAITEFVFTGFSALRALDPSACRPFGADRAGLSLGDGGAALLLMAESRARREGRRPLAALTGWGLSNDAVHVTAPARDGCGLLQAGRAALAVAGRTPADVGAVCGHGTGTVFNDAMELTAFSALFSEMRPEDRPPLFGVKGVLGHTMGAAGGVEAALCVRALAEGRVPPTAGAATPDPRAEGWVTREHINLRVPRVLTTNSGFGGVNAALLFEEVRP
jgi:3-oxoacyl-[acyl-carrier-protein] synthase II